MMDYQAAAALLYPTTAQNVPATPPVDAKATTETPKNAQPMAAASPPTTLEPNTDGHYTLTLPEDAVIETGAIERTMAFAEAAGLTPEAAQQALEHANREVSAYQEQVTNDWATLTRETWVNETKNDPEIGGEKYVGAVTDAKRFLEKFGDEELLKFLDDTGFGNNRMVIRLLARAEKGITNPRRLPGGPSGAADHKRSAQKTYPYMNP